MPLQIRFAGLLFQFPQTLQKVRQENRLATFVDFYISLLVHWQKLILNWYWRKNLDI